MDELIASECEGFTYQLDGASPHWAYFNDDLNGYVRAYLNEDIPGR